MSNLIPEKKYEAREIVDYKYFQQMVRDGWAVSQTESGTRWDATVTKGDSVVLVELKGRDYPAECFNGIIKIECKKIDYLYDKYMDMIENGYIRTKAYLVEFLWKSNVTYVFDIKDKENWKKHLEDMPNNNIDKTVKEKKWMYWIPMNEANARYTVDLTNYWTDFMTTWEELSKNND